MFVRSLCAEYETLYTDEVTDIEKLLEYCIIKVLVLVWTNLVGDGTESRNRTEGNSLEVHIQSSHDNSHATVGEFVANQIGRAHV